MELQSVLQHLGLNEKQAKVYLALLQMGTGSVPGIAIRAGTKRPTTYLLLEELRMKGLATLLPRKKKALYTAESPRKLLEEEEEKEETIRQSMPELMAIYNSQKEKPKVTYYQGEDNLIKLYDEALNSKEILFYASIASLSPRIYDFVIKKLNKIDRENMKVREILQADEKSIQFAKEYGTEHDQIKIAPENFKFPTDNMIFGNKIAIVTYKDNPQAVVIESSDVVATYRSIFEMLWNSLDAKDPETLQFGGQASSG